MSDNYETITAADMNRSERRALRRILKSSDLYQYDGSAISRRVRDTDKELKRFEIKRIHPNAISVVVEVGCVGDENDMRSVLCRHRIHAFIGPRGGITVSPRKNKTRARKYPLIWGWES